MGKRKSKKEKKEKKRFLGEKEWWVNVGEGI